MGRDLERLRCRGALGKAWKARVSGLRATAMLVVPVAAIVYLQHSLNQIWRQIPAPAALPPAGASGSFALTWNDQAWQTSNAPVPAPETVISSAHWVMAIAALLLFWPAGVLAAAYAWRAKFSLRKGDLAAARKSSSRAKNMFWISAAIFVLGLIIIASAGS
jgi:hypothetical protein